MYSHTHTSKVGVGLKVRVFLFELCYRDLGVGWQRILGRARKTGRVLDTCLLQKDEHMSIMALFVHWQGQCMSQFREHGTLGMCMYREEHIDDGPM